MSHQTQAAEATSDSPTAGFQRDGYQVLRGVLPVSMCRFVSNYYMLLVANSFMSYNDGQVERGYAAYGVPMSETLLEMMRPAVARVAGHNLYPTYSYSRVYLNGAVLERHTDRPACEISCSVTIDYKSDQPWPFCLEDLNGATHEVAMEPGDALVYRGQDVPHWRNAFEGESQLQIFLHYVRQDGPHADLKFDRRPRLGAPEIEQSRRSHGNVAQRAQVLSPDPGGG